MIKPFAEVKSQMRKKKRSKIYLYSIIAGLLILGGLFWYFREYQALPNPGYYLLASVPEPKATDRILIISPHPDDETLAVGGFIERAIQKQATISLIEVTDGNKHGLKDLRYQELKSTVALLGVKDTDITFLNFPDGSARNYIMELTLQLAQTIEQFKPNLIIYPYGYDEHPDHKAAATATQNAIKKQQVKVTQYQYLVHYPRYPRPSGYHPNFFLLPMLKTIDFSTSWSQFTLTPSEEQTKHLALNQYKTQISAKNPVLRELIVAFVRKNELFVISH